MEFEDVTYQNTKYYRNRELSWLSFNERVLGEALDKSLPLFERLKFLSITASNLDEFNMVRVASLKDLVHTEYTTQDMAGLTPKKQLKKIGVRQHELILAQYHAYNHMLIPELEDVGLKVISAHEDLDEEQRVFADQYFKENIYPVLTPMVMDSARPFPLIQNKTLNLGVLISSNGEEGISKLESATVQVPSVLSRIVELPSENKERVVILLEEIIERNLDQLFLSHRVISAHPYRIMRNADLTIEEEDAADLLAEIQKQLNKRRWGEVIRLEVEKGMDQRLKKILMKEFSIQEEDIYEIPGPLDLTYLMSLYGMKGFKKYKQPSYAPVPVLMNGGDIFQNIRNGDILLHHPYVSFQPVVEFVEQAAKDPDVLAIKQTLYRVSGKSPIISALTKAAENGKQVSVLVELKARFDEEKNIGWARMLEKAGCHVIYGPPGLKTHGKITLVVRREKTGIRRYVHLGTGNYNEYTARLYTDCGLLTCDREIGEDATSLFNMLSGYSKPAGWNKLVVAPQGMREYIIHLIRREEENARNGWKAHIIAKMNALCDREIISALYKAAAAGVKIELIVRGICCLKTDTPGIIGNITVHSIVGRFLEHARIFYFHGNGLQDIYMGSADWMPRNLDKRVEVIFPVEDEEIKREVMHILDIQLKDNVKAHILQEDGSYQKINQDSPSVCSHEYFCQEAANRVKP